VGAPDDGFAAVMTAALDAMRREDYALARDAFRRAQALRPAAPDAASGLSQAEEGLRNLAIAGHRDRGLEHERLESWRAAEAEYDQALALDGSLRFAREGKRRSAARALLQEKLDFQIGHPERLSDARAREEASRILDEAKGVDWGGPKRKEAIAKLDALLASYSRPMEVQILSDALTDVTLHRIGRLGKFDQRTLEIRPGRYVAVGSREGFRDVRVEFTVEPGKPLAPIQVRCQEAI
jgi:tetratricopeptide (TPR) repeat protein